jgi:hypothetical protein
MCRWTCGTFADGEVVWSWRPRDLALSFAQDEREATVANGMVHRGERDISRKTTAQGRPA